MTTGFSVDLASATDAAEIASLRTDARRVLSDTHGLRRREVRGESVAREVRTSHVLVGRLHGRIVATLRLDPRKPWAANLSDFTEVAAAMYVHDLAVAPPDQGRGYGRTILQRACEFSGRAMCQAIRVDAYDAVWGAGPFYAKCGFIEVGRLIYRGVPLVWFERLLAP